MASLGHGDYVVILLNVEGSKASHVKLVLQREPCPGKTWFLARSILPDEEHVDVVVRELHEEIGRILTPNDLNLLSNNRFECVVTCSQTLASLCLLGICSGTVYLN
jgi:8-oxo-dGTP pyrophosphatase MutT (NUDIX family)